MQLLQHTELVQQRLAGPEVQQGPQLEGEPDCFFLFARVKARCATAQETVTSS